MAIFRQFKPQALQRIANTMGYSGDMSGFRSYINQNPLLQERMKQLESSASQMAEKGIVKRPMQQQEQTPTTVGSFVPPPTQTFQTGGSVNSFSDGREREVVGRPVTPTPPAPINPALPQQFIPQTQYNPNLNIQDLQARQAQAPSLPIGATVVPTGIIQSPSQTVGREQGQVSGAITTPTAQATTTVATAPTTTQAQTITPTTTQEQVDQLQATAQQVARPDVIQAQQLNQSAVSNLQSAQGVTTQMVNPVQRKVQTGELISPSANAQIASTYTEQIEAATATPTQKATIQGQLESLMQQFESGNTPAWAAGAMRNVSAVMAQRGVGASSMAGQALVQAAMESALPIAQADAQVIANFEAQNLSNRQQRAMLSAQQRAAFIGQEFDQMFQTRVQNASKISDVANMNFTAEQQVALENSRAAQTMNLNNLSNKQAMVMAEASALANMDMSNLNNRQQTAVLNAQSFLQTDMTNLSNQQQTELFNAQVRQQSLFTDQAAINASRQFNATSQNQIDQFFSQLQSQVGQFNATQANAQAQFNAGQTNTIERFNAELNNQRDQFNAQNRLVIDQSNAQWRRQLATADTAAINRANEVNATALLGLSNSAYNNLWQYYGDTMEWAWTSAENERSRVVNMAIEQLRADSDTNIQNMKNDYNSSAGFGTLIGSFLTAGTDSVIGNIFNLV